MMKKTLKLNIKNNLITKFLSILFLVTHIFSYSLLANTKKISIDTFINHVRSYKGSQNWNVGKSTYCLKFIMNMTGVRIGKGSAYEAYKKMFDANAVHPYKAGDLIPVGAILWYDYHKSNNNYGHVAIYTGNKFQISVTNEGVLEKPIHYFSAPLLGYSTLREYCDNKVGSFKGDEIFPSNNVFNACLLPNDDIALPKIRFDVKTSFAEKLDLSVIKAGLVTYIKQSTWADVVEFNENYSLWLIDLTRKTKEKEMIIYFTIEIRGPSMFSRGKLILKKNFKRTFNILSLKEKTIELSDLYAVINKETQTFYHDEMLNEIIKTFVKNLKRKPTLTDIYEGIIVGSQLMLTLDDIHKRNLL